MVIILESNNKWGFGLILLTILVSIGTIVFGFIKSTNSSPNVVYSVYLDGKMIGTVASKDSFENYINNKEEELKQKYSVDTIYTPKGVEIKKNVTYSNFVNSDEDIYNRIISNKKFTVQGYKITISDSDTEKESKKEDVVIYVLTKDIFDTAIINTIKAFVDEEKYTAFMNGTQEEIKEYGSLIENIDISENITYRKTLIPTDEKIFVDAEELSKYLLYGTLDEQETYTVKASDTIETIANSHKLNVQEFLIANPEFTSENNLLYESQTVHVGLIDPVVSVVVDEHSVGEEERKYDTEIQYDSSQYVGYQVVIREGENGLYKVTRKNQYINGQLVSGVPVSSTEIKPSVSRIIVKGDKVAPHIADPSYWAWPTDTPYTITSYFAYRWGTFHKGIDIYVGYGSPVYASNNGVVVETGSGCTPGYTSCNHGTGNYVIVNHNYGGYYTVYMHLRDFSVTTGQTVARGQRIGSMGNTGDVYPVPSSYNPYGGTHLHFEVRVGGAHGTAVNPLGLF